MHQLLILSGKGGTGKTTIASAFIALSKTKAYADCDVDAPNLHLSVTLGKHQKQTDFYGMAIAKIDRETCMTCGVCKKNCAFSAIDFSDGKYSVNALMCEGCGLCERLCPVSAISMVKDKAGDLSAYHEPNLFSAAMLKMGKGNSGLLVTEVKNQLKEMADSVYENHNDLIAVVDGSPGIGCPVLASLNGVDMVLLVAEPTVSGLHDLKRIMLSVKRQGIKMAVCINKFDINKSMTDEIIAYVAKQGEVIVGTIPYDEAVMASLEEGVSIVSKKCPSADAIKKIYDASFEMLITAIDQKTIQIVY